MNKQLLLPPGKTQSIQEVQAELVTINITGQEDVISKLQDDKSIFVSALDILNNPTIERSFLVEPIIPGATITMLTGPSDTGKSIFARQLAISVALGKDEVFGLKLNIKYGKAIVISTEDDAGDWKEKINKYCLNEQDKLLLENLSLVLEGGFSITELESRLKQSPVDLVVVDVFTDIFEKDLNNAINVRGFFKPYKALGAKYGCTFLFLHHLSKKGESSAPSKMNVLGSQGIESSMRCVLELRPDPTDDSSRHIIITKSNYLSTEEKKDSFKLQLNQSTFEFSFTGERAAKDSLGKIRTTGTDKKTIDTIMRLHEARHSVRDISELLEKDGITIGKSKVAEILKKSGRANSSDQ